MGVTTEPGTDGRGASSSGRAVQDDLAARVPLHLLDVEDDGYPIERSRLMAQLVDRVVDAIEQRVVDELERRGRHRVPGVF